MGYKKITKPTARKLFYSDKEIIIIRNKCGIGSIFQSTAKLSDFDIMDRNKPDLFDVIVNSFEYYNHEAELGNYTHFYTKTN